MKYIVEIAKEYEEYFKGILICGIAEGKFAVDVIAKEDLEQLNSDYINEHYGDLQDTAYQRGLNDAWNVARKIAMETDDGGVSISALYEMFGTESMCMIMKNNTVYDATDKLKAYEEKQKADNKIEVGDEVIYNGTTKCIVVRPEDDERYASLIDSDGTHYFADHRECKKTGRHFDIHKILKEMKE